MPESERNMPESERNMPESERNMPESERNMPESERNMPESGPRSPGPTGLTASRVAFWFVALLAGGQRPGKTLREMVAQEVGLLQGPREVQVPGDPPRPPAVRQPAAHHGDIKVHTLTQSLWRVKLGVHPVFRKDVDTRGRMGQRKTFLDSVETCMRASESPRDCVVFLAHE